MLDAASSRASSALSGQLAENSSLAIEVRHELSPADLERAALRTNPDRSEARSIVQGLRRKRTDLLNLRVQVAGQFRAALAANGEPASSGALLNRLKLIDIEIAQTEDALDLASDLFGPGAARQADRAPARRRSRSPASDWTWSAPRSPAPRFPNCPPG